ncbi:TPA: type 4b pilus protein PilO2 [Kluyvera ascorbata]|nr:type 4b pilus protein PilO2 [Kluyvera ascorbata]
MSRTEYLVIARDENIRTQYWLAGMLWAPLETPGKGRARFRARPIASKQKHAGIRVSVLARHGPGKKPPVKIGGTGRIPARTRHKHLFSLALAFSMQVRDGYGVYRLNSTDYVFLASINGIPAVTADKTGSAEYMAECVLLFLAMNEEPEGGWEIRSGPEVPSELSALTGALTERNKRLCRVVRAGEQLKHVAPLAALLIGITGAVFWWDHHQIAPEPTLTPEQIKARAKEMFASTVPAQIAQPWDKDIPAQALLTLCGHLQSPSPIFIGGWQQRSGTCSPDGVALLYQILPGGTAEKFKKRVYETFGVYPVFNFKEGGREATVLLPLPAHPTTNEPPTQLLRVLSWFQQRQTALSLNKVSSIPVLPGNNDPRSALGWEDYAFSFKGPVPPALLFYGMDTSGIRISRIKYEINGSAFSYTTEGHIYASIK